MPSRSYLPTTESRKRVSLQEIDSVVVARLGATRGLGKSQPACFNRQVAMYLAKQLTSRSLPEIGRKFGNRDHTTVMHAVSRVGELMQRDVGFAEDVELLRRMLES